MLYELFRAVGLARLRPRPRRHPWIEADGMSPADPSPPPQEVLEAAREGRLGPPDADALARRIEARKSDVSVTRILLDALGHAGGSQHAETVARFLRGSEPELEALALQILVTRWNLGARFTDEIARATRASDPLVDDGDLQLAALGVAGEVVRTVGGPSASVLVPRPIETVQDPIADPWARQQAYFAPLRATGTDWVNMPAASRLHDLDSLIDHAVLRPALALVTGEGVSTEGGNGSR